MYFLTSFLGIATGNSFSQNIPESVLDPDFEMQIWIWIQLVFADPNPDPDPDLDPIDSAQNFEFFTFLKFENPSICSGARPFQSW